MTVSAKKKLLREKMRERERSLSEKYLLYSSFEICRRLVAMPAFDMAKSIFCFIGVRGEIDTQPILEAALSQNKALYVPRCVSAGIMELCRLHSLSELIPGAFGIPEPPETAERTQPDSIDLAVIPCLACARDGRRLGSRALTRQTPGLQCQLLGLLGGGGGVGGVGVGANLVGKFLADGRAAHHDLDAAGEGLLLQRRHGVPQGRHRGGQQRGQAHDGHVRVVLDLADEGGDGH